MTHLRLDISTSLDGYVAGPNPSLEQPLGVGGELLHEWLVRLAGFRAQHGMEGGEVNEDTPVYEETLGAGASIMGRRMFSGGSGPWEDDPNANGWWGDDPPFDTPVFVLTHHERGDLVLGGTTFVFVTDGVESALAQARAAAGDRRVAVGGGADVARQFLDAGFLDELAVHLVPVLLGGGTRLFEGAAPTTLKLTKVVASPSVTHLTYRPTDAL
jgi:dihydrofolate reductase